MPDEPTFWNGEPTPARKVTLVVADSGVFPMYWAKPLVGTRRAATEVIYNGETFYLDDEEYDDGDGPEVGWRKVTAGHGSPHYRHRELQAEPGSVEPRG